MESGIVFVYPLGDAPGARTSHEWMTLESIARRIAALRGDEYGGVFDAARAGGGRGYLVPGRTITPDEAQLLGVRDERDLFGGVVPWPFVATKTITHPLPQAKSVAPTGWSNDFARHVGRVVLPGFSAFSALDAMVGGLRLLQRGAVRLKLADGIGGAGQWVVDKAGDLEERLGAIGGETLSHGVVLEENLRDVTTLSVGFLRVGDRAAAYYGTQSEVVNNHGHVVYGGSELTVMRGGREALLDMKLPRQVRIACEQAFLYDSAADACFPGLHVSRRNYDVVQGIDARGQWCSGVLEQSWRIGGATGAEIAALESFARDPSLTLVKASTTERYGEHAKVPHGAVVYYQGVDEHVGPLVKYAQVM